MYRLFKKKNLFYLDIFNRKWGAENDMTTGLMKEKFALATLWVISIKKEIRGKMTNQKHIFIGKPQNDENFT